MTATDTTAKPVTLAERLRASASFRTADEIRRRHEDIMERINRTVAAATVHAKEPSPDSDCERPAGASAGRPSPPH